MKTQLIKISAEALFVVFLLANDQAGAMERPGEEIKETRQISAVQQQREILNPTIIPLVLPDEVLLRVFSFFNQKDIPSVIGTCKKWQELMGDNHLWKIYAKRALIIMDENGVSQDRDYKELIKSHCMPSFTDLGILGKGGFFCTRMSSDGLVAVGYVSLRSISPEDYDHEGVAMRAVRWNSEIGTVLLETLNGGSESAANGVTSNNGGMIVGTACDGAAKNQQRAVRWVQDSNGTFHIESLETLNGGSWSEARGVSPDGRVIVGCALDGAARDQHRAVRWIQDSNGTFRIESLETLNGGSASWANDVNSDGMIVGAARDGDAENQQRAVRWIQGIGGIFRIEPLETLSEGASTAQRISDRGSIIVGTVEGAKENWGVFRWTAEKGMESLKRLADEKDRNKSILGKISKWLMQPDPVSYSNAGGVSFDGLRIAGPSTTKYSYSSTPFTSTTAFMWTPEKGMYPVESFLRGVLPSLGRLISVSPQRLSYADFVSNWRLNSVRAITPNGVVLVGEGHNGEKLHAWRAVIPRGNLF